MAQYSTLTWKVNDSYIHTGVHMRCHLKYFIYRIKHIQLVVADIILGFLSRVLICLHNLVLYY